jgi:hypothetical protein
MKYFVLFLGLILSFSSFANNAQTYEELCKFSNLYEKPCFQSKPPISKKQQAQMCVAYAKCKSLEVRKNWLKEDMYDEFKAHVRACNLYNEQELKPYCELLYKIRNDFCYNNTDPEICKILEAYKGFKNDK